LQPERQLCPFGLRLSKPEHYPRPFGLRLTKPEHCSNPFGLSLSKPVWRWLPRACVQGGGRESPGVRVPFFRVAERKEPKKGRPHCLRPCASLRGNLWCSRAGCAAELAALRCSSAQTAAASQFTMRVCPSAHAPPRPLRSSAHTEGIGERTSLRAIASLGPGRGARALRAARCGSSAAMTRVAVRLFGCSALPPLLAAPAPGRLRGGTRVGARVLRDLTRRGCPSGARQRKASSTAHPATAPAQVCPAAKRRGRRLRVAFSLVTFFWRSKRKLLARRATPGLRPERRHAVTTAKPGFDRLSPNGWECNARRLRQAQPEQVGVTHWLHQALPERFG